ncbi:NADH:ubiquinone oxidoreductase subunit M [Fibrobacterales bacterium]|nr:NADH:ubiquinone oxidoreductase subunit M [Fibrobacterales bacterium]
MLISLLLISPFVGAISMLASSSRDAKSTFRIGLFFSALPLVLATALLFIGGSSTEPVHWFNLPGIGDSAGIEVSFSLFGYGLSLWMAWLTSLLTFLAFAYASSAVSFGIREFAVAFFALEGTIIGSFLSAENIVQFLFFFEAMILPAAVLISIHGGVKRKFATEFFAIYTLVGSIPLLFGAWYLASIAGSSNISDLALALSALPKSTQIALLVAFSIAFATKTPLFPLHSWQGISYSEAPYPLTAILSGAMAKVGVFGFAFWVIPIFSHGLYEDEWNLYFIAIGLFSMIYGGLLALRQRNVKKLLAFSSLSHLGLAVAGLFCLNDEVNAGVAVLLVGHGLTAGGLFLLSGIAQKWTGSVDIKSFGAFATTNPVYATIFGIIGIAAVAVPGTVGFVGEFLILKGLFNSALPFFALIGGVGIILSAAYTLRLIKNTLFGEVAEGVCRSPLSTLEGVAAIPVILLIFYFGLHPAPILNSLSENRTGCTTCEYSDLIDEDSEMDIEEFLHLLDSLQNSGNDSTGAFATDTLNSSPPAQTEQQEDYYE